MIFSTRLSVFNPVQAPLTFVLAKASRIDGPRQVFVTKLHADGSGLDYYKVLTGRFGLFTEAEENRLEILHQGFGKC